MSTKDRRHPFRWSLAIVTVLYLVCLSLIVGTPVKSSYVAISDPGREQWVPINCTRSRGTYGDYTPFSAPGPNGPSYCHYPLSRFRALFPEYDDMSDRRLIAMLDQQVGKPPRQLPSFLEIAVFRLVVRFYISLPMLIAGGFLIRGIVEAIKRSRSGLWCPVERHAGASTGRPHRKAGAAHMRR